MIIGAGEGENFIASDIPAILEHTRNIYLLGDNELAVVEKEKVSFYNTAGESIEKEEFKVDWDISEAEKSGYEHFMLKEIHEQPKAIKDTMSAWHALEHSENRLGSFSTMKKEHGKINKIYIVACGTASYAGMVGKLAIEDLCAIPCEVSIASEFRYKCPTVDEHSLTIVISQSGETLDTLMALKEAKKKGSLTLGIINVVGSSIARESDDVLYTLAGPEIAVASTKAFTSQLIAVYEIAIYLAVLKNRLTAQRIETIKEEMLSLPKIVEAVLSQKGKLRSFARRISAEKDVFFLGRGFDYPIALEGALKLKELSYIHSEAYPAGEMKHGPIALIENGTLVVIVSTQDELQEKMLSSIKEVKARGAFVFCSY